MKILMLDDYPSYRRALVENNNCEIRKPHVEIRTINKILHRLSIRFYIYWYDDWKNSLSDYSIIIIFTYTTSLNLIEYICRKKSMSQRVIIWYWNPVFRSLDPNKIRHLDCELWSFDNQDCELYNMRFNTTFYFKELSTNREQNNEFDVVFLGINKGRLHDILRIEQIIKQKGLRTFFYIVDEKEYRKYRKPRVSYETYLTWIDKSKCILDIVQEGQTGATLRVMESLFFNKKLLTTGKSIVNEDFYNSTNIFVIGQDSWESLHDFMTKPYQPVPEKIINKYEFKNWINRFSN